MRVRNAPRSAEVLSGRTISASPRPNRDQRSVASTSNAAEYPTYTSPPYSLH